MTVSKGGEVEGSGLARHGVRFLISGMESLGFFELRTDRDRIGDFVLGRAVAGAIGGRYRFFGLLPRRLRGARKEHVAAEANLLWLDIDSRDALGQLYVFERLGMPPSAVVDSGGGYWVYWKLDTLVATDQVEEWNRRLVAYAAPKISGVDVGCWNRNRTARLVGAVHEDSGVTAHFVAEECTWETLSAPVVEWALSKVPLPRQDIQIAPGPKRTISVDRYREQVASIYNRFRWYLEDTTEEDVHAQGQSRYKIEFAIVCCLIEEADCSDAEIRSLFDEWEPLKHAARKAVARTNPYEYLDLTIGNARKQVVPGSRPGQGKAKRAWNPVDRWNALRIVAEAELADAPLKVGAACDAIVAEHPGTTFRTAENALIQLEKSGYIDKLPDPNARGKLVVMTDKAWELYYQDGYRRGWHFLEPIRPSESGVKLGRFLTRGSRRRPETLPLETEFETTAEAEQIGTTQTPEEGEEGTEAEIEEEGDNFPFCGYRGEHFGLPETYGYEGSRYLRHAAADLPDERLEAVLEREWIDDWYRLSFLGHKTTRLIQFITDWGARVPNLLFYEQLQVGVDEYPTSDAGLAGYMQIFRSFISQRDPQLGGTAAYDPIAQGSWVGWNGKPRKVTPWPFTFGLALELTPEMTPVERRVVDRSGEETVLPCFGMVIERDWVFWRSLKRSLTEHELARLDKVVLRVSRSGTQGAHHFQFEIARDAIEFTPPSAAEIDLEEVLDELSSEQRLDTYINTLPPGHRL